MYRGTLENGSITKREIGHEGHPTWDVWHCHPNNKVYPEGGGVRRSSTIHVYLQEPDRSTGKPWGEVRIAVYLPDGIREETAKWGEEKWWPISDWSQPSVVSLDDAPLKVVWESVPGKE